MSRFTTSAKLVELAERCEAATGPDRELDAEIGAAVRAMPMNDPDAWISGWPHPFIAAPQFKGSIAALDKSGGIVCHWEARNYTASLDAAMTLVPEGWGYSICPTSVLLTRSTTDAGIMSRAATPALALCAAALRARSAGVTA